MEFIWRLMTKSLRDRIKQLKGEIQSCHNDMDKLRCILKDCENDNLKKDIIIERQEISLKSLKNKVNRG